jgi:Domain of unknown function (DUF3883)
MARLEDLTTGTLVKGIMAAERQLGFEPVDVSADNRGYDVESRITSTGKLRFLEVKGRAIGADSITITRNEIMTALNKPDDFILAIVTVDLSASNGQAGADKADPRYVPPALSTRTRFCGHERELPFARPVESRYPASMMEL